VPQTEQDLMGVSEIAEYCGVRKPNVRKMLELHGVQPVARLALGPVYAKADIEAMQEKRLADEGLREKDRKIREAMGGGRG
jgi:hypothetical protein